MDIHSLGNVDDELNIGEVVVICASRDFGIVVSHANVVSIGFEVFGSGHDGEVNCSLVAECLIGPFSN